MNLDSLLQQLRHRSLDAARFAPGARHARVQLQDVKYKGGTGPLGGRDPK